MVLALPSQVVYTQVVSSDVLHLLPCLLDQVDRVVVAEVRTRISLVTLVFQSGRLLRIGSLILLCELKRNHWTQERRPSLEFDGWLRL